MKLVVVPNNLDNIDKFKEIGADAFIFGLKNYSVNYNVSLSIEEIKIFLDNNKDVELFISINKNLFNDEIKDIEEILKALDKLNIKGILFYDLAILNIKIKNKLSLDLVWNQTHMVTNYNTCNYYYDKGVKFGVLSGEITLEEMNEIKEHTDMDFFANIFGFPVMAHSRRTLLNNYFLSNKLKKKNDSYVIVNNNEEYLIKEESCGDTILYGKPLNGVDLLLGLKKIKYGILIEDNVENDLFCEILSLYSDLNRGRDLEKVQRVNRLIGDYQGFIHNKTIYKVKKND